MRYLLRSSGVATQCLVRFGPADPGPRCQPVKLGTARQGPFPAGEQFDHVQHLVRVTEFGVLAHGQQLLKQVGRSRGGQRQAASAYAPVGDERMTDREFAAACMAVPDDPLVPPDADLQRPLVVVMGRAETGDGQMLGRPALGVTGHPYRLGGVGQNVISEAFAAVRSGTCHGRSGGAASRKNYSLLLPDYRRDCYSHSCCTASLSGAGVAGPQRSHTSAEGRCSKSGRVTPGTACSQFLVGRREDFLLGVGAVALHITPRELEQPPRPCDTPPLADITEGDPGGKGHTEALDRCLAWFICCHIRDLSGSACVVTSEYASVVT